MSEAKDLVVVEQPPAEEQPAPPRPAPRAPEPSVVERVLLFVELAPWTTALIIFGVLTLLHVTILNIAGVAEGLYVGNDFLLFSPPNSVTIMLLAFVAYNIVLPTLLSHGCIRAYDTLRPSLMLDDRGYGETRAGIVDPFVGWRFWCALAFAVILTPSFGEIWRQQLPGDGSGYALQAIWLYLRIAAIFGLIGSSLAYVIRLHRAFRAVTAEHLRVDLFDLAPLRPIPRYAKLAAFYLIIPMALLGPAIVEPDAMVQGIVVFAVGLLLVALGVVAALLGARHSIRSAKKTAVGEISAYARELWRRAYVGQRIVEAVAVPALGAMITTRAEIRRVSEWPGGLGVAGRFVVVALIPVITWFGAPIVASVTALLAR
ncbi:MAG: hypothetical protein GC190_10615 [Alphaproteobacteria bacterium]|nr:hypothetical protein [Alphaproteobacteria bacterium]